MNCFRCLCCDAFKPMDDLEAQWTIVGDSKARVLMSNSLYGRLGDVDRSIYRLISICLKCYDDLGVDEANKFVLFQFHEGYSEK